MNCKPGDLAVMIRSDDRRNIGLLMTVVEAHPKLFRYWIVELHGRGIDTRTGSVAGANGRKVRAHDDDLRPIRDPGEDAQDETLSWLPVPEKEGVPA